MAESTHRGVSVSRRIEASVPTVFAVLLDPVSHCAIDGSGMLREAITTATIVGVGDTFTIRMHNDEMGGYEITNHVVEFERDRLVSWEPVLTAASREEDAGDLGERAGHRWTFHLTAPEPGATLVTETYDSSRAPEWLRRAVRNGERWRPSMLTTLERLDALCAR